MAEIETSLEDQRTYARVGNVLRAGLWLSIVIMILGILLTGLQGKAQAREVLPLDRIIPAIQAHNSAVVLDLGILLLFATPLVAVLTALTEFVTHGDRAFTGIALALLIILVIGFVVALR